MRAPIRILSEDVTNKIAAGEVIERPASVVKELVENAIDAGASRISVEVRGAGKELIRVVDDGIGIPAGEAPLAFMRHATSKISAASDLAAISTLGFRGEALPSIASVARVELITRAREAEEGVRVEAAGGDIRTSVCGAPYGTQVSVFDLFYNTPARFKFLRSDTAERRYIADFVTAIALAHPQIAFRLSLEGRQVLSTSGSGNLKEAIAAVYGRSVLPDLVPVEWAAPWGALTGYVGKPSLAKGNRAAETLFVNGRWVQNRTLYAAVEKGFESLLAHRRFPLAVLHLRIDPSLVDVNVHPAKTDVRFRDENEVFRAVMRAVRAALTQANLVTPLGQPRVFMGRLAPEEAAAGFEADEGEALQQARISWESWAPPRKRRSDLPPLPEWAGEERTEYPLSGMAHGGEGRQGISPKAANGDQAPDRGEQAAAPTGQGRAAADRGFSGLPLEPAAGAADGGGGAHTGLPLAGEEALRVMRRAAAEAESYGFDPRELLATAPVLGQVAGTYLAVAVPFGLWLIDQHVAHERILYEEVLRAANGRDAVVQELLMPIPVTLAPALAAALIDHQEDVRALGFVVEQFGGNDFLLRAVPAAIGARPQDALAGMLEELAAAVAQGGPSRRERAAASLACRGAVKAGQRLQPEAMQRLVRDLAAVENPFACPHGRPIIVQIDLGEIERRFGRR